jgi:hypothetical protein
MHTTRAAFACGGEAAAGAAAEHEDYPVRRPQVAFDAVVVATTAAAAYPNEAAQEANGAVQARAPEQGRSGDGARSFTRRFNRRRWLPGSVFSSPSPSLSLERPPRHALRHAVKADPIPERGAGMAGGRARCTHNST